MDTYSIVGRAGLYSVVATVPDGRDRVVITCTTEGDAIEAVRQLQAAVRDAPDAIASPASSYSPPGQFAAFYEGATPPQASTAPTALAAILPTG
jgi:hypothetical protein